MTFLDSLLVDGFGLSIVFVVLISLSLIIKLISIIVRQFKKPESKTETLPDQTAGQELQTLAYADGEMKLLDVDEKTAAMIMAIVSDQTEIPLSQLQFKSIRLIKQEGK